MITPHVQSAIVDIDALITLTKLDIDAIKEAQHETLGERLAEKEHLIAAFERKKALLNSELLNLVKRHEGKSLEQILSTDESDVLSQFKERLVMLKTINKEYAKFVATIAEFYNSLIDKMFTLEGEGYEKNKLRPATLFRVSA